MRDLSVTKMTITAMMAALVFICFTYLRIEVPMGGGMTGKIYIGHAFILLTGFLLGGKYGGMAGAVGLCLADVLAGYVLSAPPTLIAKFLLGFTAGIVAKHFLNIDKIEKKYAWYVVTTFAGIAACTINVITEPVIRYGFKHYILGYPEAVAYVSAVNCAVSMAVSAVPSVILAVFLYALFRKKNLQIE